MTAQDIEIMAPVGSYESLMAAIKGGANSVYFWYWQPKYAFKIIEKFHLDDLVKISDICKDNNIRTYITLNTVIYDNEINTCTRLLMLQSKTILQPLLLSDQSVIQYASSQGVEIHMSTQTKYY